MGNIGIWELVIIAILVVIIFGGRKLPELGRGLGQGLSNFRRAVSDPDQTSAKNPGPVKKEAPAAEVNHMDKDVQMNKENSQEAPRADQEK